MGIQLLHGKNPFKSDKTRIDIKWDKPPNGTIKLNIDGAFSSNNKVAGLGGTFKNSNGDWIVGFHKVSHAISPTHAELMALQEGLKVAKEMNFQNMEIETYCTEVVKLIYEDSYNFSNIVNECRWLMHQLKPPPPPLLKHNFREGNAVAHVLAKEAIKNPSSTKCFYHARPPFFVEQEVYFYFCLLLSSSNYGQ
ncbi:PREDICTED: uncharacterized protein LOC109216573 [Nicotiana attenuata]|uniref:uncharacterized protein LOC109216573 n=1 Tax=Nicotiana attenuata TaxID=49451 RepID=UPI000905B164|nr:PREDICTED: uncharacterized protein LOC109216573 [Nicotiana attenuata]